MKNFGNRFLLAIFLFNSLCSLSMAGEIVLIVNPANPIKEMQVQQLKQIYLGQRTYFPNSDRKVIPIDHAKGAIEREVFYKIFINMSKRKLKRYWSKKVFSGQASPPQTMLSTEGIVSWVANNPSGIAYVFKKHISKEVKILKLR